MPDPSVGHNGESRWWITTGPLDRRSTEKKLGPFVSCDLAIQVRTYIEAVENRSDLCVDKEKS